MNMRDFPLLAGKRGLVVGVANDWSLGWGMAQAAHAAGAELAFSYLNEALEKRVRPLADTLGTPPARVLPCDVQRDADLDALMARLKGWGKLDFIIHAVAYANKEELKGGITNSTRAGFATALDVSCYSLIGLVKAALAAEMLADDASVVTLTYVGGEKVVPNYNVMGVAKAALESAVRYLAAELGPRGMRVNALSAGPVKTLAASGIGDFKAMLRHHETTAPLRRLTSQDEVARTGVYLLSPLSAGVTGQVVYVDGGASVLGPTPMVSGQ